MIKLTNDQLNMLESCMHQSPKMDPFWAIILCVVAAFVVTMVVEYLTFRKERRIK